MTVISEAIENIAGLADNTAVLFYVEDLRPRASGSGIVTPTRVSVKPVAGVLTTPDLNPGPAKVMYGMSSYNIVIPDSPTPVALWPLIRDYIPQTLPVVNDAVAARNGAVEAQTAAEEARAAAEAALAATEAAASVVGSKIFYDTDGVPYFEPNAGAAGASLAADTDGVPYLIGA